MNKNQVIAKSVEKSSKLSDYLMLSKFRLSLFVVISSVMAYIVAVGMVINWPILAMLAIGGFCCTAASNGLNQVLEKDFDRLMVRTQTRPLPANRMRSSEAVLFSGIMLLIGTVVLSWINPLTSFLAMISVVLYAFVYTPLKRHTTLSVAIGAIPGALPVLIGAVAGSGTITLLGIVLFLIQFLWQFPHFWAIGWLSFDDYNNAGYKLLPVNNEGEIHQKLGWHMLIYAVILIPVSILPIIYTEVNVLVTALIVITGLYYAFVSYKFYQKQERTTALKVMFTSFFYLPIVLMLYMFI